ncbi:conserved domain protein [Mycoplasmopsis alligatoris A21JP2]|uniref:Conserved domain protein n=1 Tax=Mycoplasmopsis alligatoris A21JP2 TaxID=747682 RepID=D4XV97_9BACT|nr:conserved domain protein [Mycoplasmopsis alligatoris A21JP2]
MRKFKKTFVNTENELDFLYKINNFKFDNQYYINKKITNNKVTFFITQLKELTLYI